MAGDAVLLLGSGPVGRAVAPLLARDRGVGSIIVADPQLERASATAELCNGKANAVRLDDDDDDALGRILDDVDLAVNTRNLPTDSLLPLIRNVVEAGVSYADATDDPDSLQAVFDSEYLSSLAEYRAVGVIPGLGVSPGQTNALAPVSQPEAGPDGGGAPVSPRRHTQGYAGEVAAEAGQPGLAGARMAGQ